MTSKNSYTQLISKLMVFIYQPSFIFLRYINIAETKSTTTTKVGFDQKSVITD